MNTTYENNFNNSYNFLFSIQTHFLFIVSYSIHKVLLYRQTTANWSTKSTRMFLNYFGTVGKQDYFEMYVIYIWHVNFHIFKCVVLIVTAMLDFAQICELYKQLTVIMHDTGPIPHSERTLL